ncbi:putative transcriptional regulator, TetR family protein [Sphaerisporangium rufum]|uniref:Transcriptional regulator, TetR family protein n=1 Tax=Sphaerisporangium rufum TaxID=1381558 RepID=A0A919V0H7_9ACTN|nr:TetR/AcrR family transcriptional regulator [Sphaerisporangium rufum]GII77442.1 putative transcriptional regulator, TetR family protein [Sphaerisporangium rufum]
MPQPVKHSIEAMLDAARALVLAGGPAAASARAVCQATGASSGSVYHRFPRRDDLVAAAWLRAQDRFLHAYLDALEPASAEAAAHAAVSVLTWCGAHPEDAALLLRHSLRDLLRGDISPALAARAEADRQALDAALTATAAATGIALPDLILAVVDLPYAVARRTLRDGATPTPADAAALHRAATLLLADRPC